MTESHPRSLGSGIARSSPDQHLDRSFIRIAYSPNSEMLGFFRTLGFAFSLIEETEAIKKLKPSMLGLTELGDVWRKDENGRAEIVATKVDLISVQRIIKKFGKDTTLNEYENKDSGRRILFKQINSGKKSSVYELWLSKKPQDIQILIDAIFCVNFHQPATNELGTILSEEQILEEARRVGITFNMSSEGKVLLPQI